MHTYKIIYIYYRSVLTQYVRSKGLLQLTSCLCFATDFILHVFLLALNAHGVRSDLFLAYLNALLCSKKVLRG